MAPMAPELDGGRVPLMRGQEDADSNDAEDYAAKRRHVRADDGGGVRADDVSVAKRCRGQAVGDYGYRPEARADEGMGDDDM